MAATIDDVSVAFETFKRLNDARLAEIEKTGSASAASIAAVERANADITNLTDRIREEQDRTAARLDELDDRLLRTQTLDRGVRPDEDILNLYAGWMSTVRNKTVEPGDVDLDFIREYRVAYTNWLRHGDRAAGPLNDLSVGSDPDGGYWVDPDTSGRIVTMVYESSPMRRLASVQPISTDSLEGIADLDEAASGGWVGETDARAATNTPQIGRWSIPVREVFAQPRATQKLLDDAAVDVEAWLASKVASKFAREEASAFVDGNGELKPRGFLTYAAGTPTAADWQKIQQVDSGSGTALLADGLIDLIYSMKAEYRRGAVLGANRSTLGALRKLKGTDDAYLWQTDFSQGAGGQILGFPVEEFADMPDVAGGALPVVFANFMAAYQIVDRVGIRTTRDPYTAKPYVVFYSTKRVGGDVVNFEAIKLQLIST